MGKVFSGSDIKPGFMFNNRNSPFFKEPYKIIGPNSGYDEWHVKSPYNKHLVTYPTNILLHFLNHGIYVPILSKEIICQAQK